jgi:hypothetical protein
MLEVDFEVMLVNAAHLKYVPGRKTDLLTEPQHVAAGHRSVALRHPARHRRFGHRERQIPGCDLAPGPDVSGHTVLNGIPSSSSLPLFGACCFLAGDAAACYPTWLIMVWDGWWHGEGVPASGS